MDGNPELAELIARADALASVRHCPACGLAFGLLGALNRHIVRDHPRADLDPSDRCIYVEELD